MTKTDLIAKMAEDADISKAAAEKALKSFIESVTESLSDGEKITLVGFGTFSVVERKEREGRNPRTKEKLVIPASKVVKFKVGSNLKKAVDES